MCADSEAKFYPQREVCYASMEREAANAKWQELHKDRPWHNGSWSSWAKERSASHPYHRDHGLVIGVAETDLRPDDRFLAAENCGPPLPANEPEEQQDGADDRTDHEDDTRDG